MPAEPISLLGAGAWGTTLARILAENGHRVQLWVREPELVASIRDRRENPLYLPGIGLPEGIRPTDSLAEALSGSRIVLVTVPSQSLRPTLEQARPFVPKGAVCLCASKGIEQQTLLLMTEVIRSILPELPDRNLAVLSGPSFAKEVCQCQPTAVTLACPDLERARSLARMLTTSYFKVFTSTDRIGVQLGGALKNIIAIAAGIAEGLGLGTNTQSLLIARGLSEIQALGQAMGALPETLAGLSGLGDLVLTCSGRLSRNKQVGIQLGRGRRLEEILQQTRTVAEGIETTRSAYALAQKHGITMPIVERVYGILFEGKAPIEVIAGALSGAGGPEGWSNICSSA